MLTEIYNLNNQYNIYRLLPVGKGVAQCGIIIIIEIPPNPVTNEFNLQLVYTQQYPILDYNLHVPRVKVKHNQQLHCHSCQR